MPFLKKDRRPTVEHRGWIWELEDDAPRSWESTREEVGRHVWFDGGAIKVETRDDVAMVPMGVIKDLLNDAGYAVIKVEKEETNG